MAVILFTGYLAQFLFDGDDNVVADRPSKRGTRDAVFSEKTGRLPPGVANPIDIHVGMRLRLRRILVGFSQEKLGAEVGLTFQQIQKYERGANRIGASRLFQFSEILDVPVSFFFEDLPEEIQTRRGAYTAGMSHSDRHAIEEDPFVKRETLELVRYYYAITDPGVRRKIFELTKSVARSEGGLPEDDEED